MDPRPVRRPGTAGQIARIRDALALAHAVAERLLAEAAERHDLDPIPPIVVPSP